MGEPVRQTTSGDCFATGDILPTSRFRGDESGTALFGKVVESPIVLDYIKETHKVELNGVPFALLLGTDWWDLFIGPKGKQSYFDFLVKKHTNLKRSELEKLNPEPARPDLITRNGPRYSAQGTQFVMNRNEYYEIKPDSPTGLSAWYGENGDKKTGKKYKLNKFYRDFALPYKEGTYYPDNVLQTKTIPLPLNRVFAYIASVFLKRHRIKRVLLYITVRRHEPGLLLYKICIEIETDDKRKQQALAKAAAKSLYAAYVVSHFPERFKSIEPELGDYSFEGEKFPRPRCTFNVIDELRPLEKSLSETIFMRGIGLPGEKYLVCCDETYYQGLVAKPPVDQVKDLWEQLQSKAERWVTYAGGSIGWSKVKPLFLEAERLAKYINLLYPDAKDFANLILNWIREHPYATAAIVVTAVVVTAGVAAFVEAGLLGAVAIGTEGAITEASTTQVVSGLGRVAMTESVAAPIVTQEVAAGAAARGFVTAQQVAAQIGGLGAGANDVALLANAVARPLLAGAVTKTAAMGMAAAFVLMINSSTAYAQDISPGLKVKPTGPVDAKTTPIIAQHASRLFIVRAPADPSNRPPVQGNLINLNQHAEQAPKDLGNLSRKGGIDFSQAASPVVTRYLGSLTIS